MQADNHMRSQLSGPLLTVGQQLAFNSQNLTSRSAVNEFKEQNTCLQTRTEWKVHQMERPPRDFLKRVDVLSKAIFDTKDIQWKNHF